MKLLKIIGKLITIFILGVILLIGGYLFNLDVMPEIKSKKEIEDIEEYASQISDIEISDNIKVVGLGEATHGNKEFQDLKLDVLKLLVEKYNFKAYAMEIEYAEGVIINNYIKGNCDLSINEVMNHISFDIYRTESIKNIIEWMKQYNEVNNNVLSFYGFDIQNPEVDMYVLTEYIKKNNIDSLLPYTQNYTRFMNGEINFKNEIMIKAFEDIEYIKDELSNDKYLKTDGYSDVMNCIDNIFIARTLSQTVEEDSTLVKYGEYRDQKMCERILSLIENDDKLMISAHNGHVGYAGSYVKTMGSNIKDILADKYFVIGTDYYDTVDNIKSGDTRKDYRFCSADILAYQARRLGDYYLDFSKIDENSNVYQYINDPINTGSVGESYSILNHVLASTVRIHCEVKYLYDAMIFMYKVKPIQVIEKK